MKTKIVLLIALCFVICKVSYAQVDRTEDIGKQYLENRVPNALYAPKEDVKSAAPKDKGFTGSSLLREILRNTNIKTTGSENIANPEPKKDEFKLASSESFLEAKAKLDKLKSETKQITELNLMQTEKKD